jgi:hypothetical protein
LIKDTINQQYVLTEEKDGNPGHGSKHPYLKNMELVSIH